MTTSTTKDHPSDAKPDAKPEAVPDAAIDPPPAAPPARTTQPGVAVPPITNGSDLESRIKLRRAELIGRLGSLRADTRLAATELRDRMKAKLSELAHITKIGVVDGWANLGDTVKRKLEHWLTESERAPSVRDLPAKNEQS